MNDFVVRYGTSYEEALDRLYRSDMFKGICDSKTTLSTWAPQDLLDRYENTEREPIRPDAGEISHRTPSAAI
jgi:hypothetical protein